MIKIEYECKKKAMNALSLGDTMYRISNLKTTLRNEVKHELATDKSKFISDIYDEILEIIDYETEM